MRKISILILVVFVSGIISCSTEKSNRREVENIIFMIGDGMGIGQVYAAMLRSGTGLNMEKCEYTGFCTTWSANKKVTDSAAGGTALATGTKTKNGMIGQDSLGNDLVSILKIAEQHGLATGLISTSAITHATPASFIANENSRGDYEAIASDFLKTDIDLFIGGGLNHFANRSDSLNLTDSLLARGYSVLYTMDEVENFKTGKMAALLYPVHAPRYSEGRGEMLPEATSKALELLSSSGKGLFLMVEGSQIDWGGHANDASYVEEETLDFDRALGVVLEFMKEHPNTLVVVTADHETGGLTLPADTTDSSKAMLSFSTEDHTAVMVPVFAFGKGAEKFTGIMDNTDFFNRFIEIYGFDTEK